MSYVTDSIDSRIIKLLKNGAVGFMPSDTIYGLSCRALDEPAVKRLHALKDRGAHKPFIVLISDMKMLDLLSISYNEVITAEKYWPGPLNLICRAPAAPGWLSLDTQSLAIRIPANKELQKLIRQTGPLVSTSANPGGKPPASSVAAAKKYFGDKLDFYVDIGEVETVPSTLVKVENGKLVVVREGTVKLNDT